MYLLSFFNDFNIFQLECRKTARVLRDQEKPWRCNMKEIVKVEKVEEKDKEKEEEKEEDILVKKPWRNNIKIAKKQGNEVFCTFWYIYVFHK